MCFCPDKKDEYHIINRKRILDFSKIKTIPISQRKHKVKISGFGAMSDDNLFSGFYDSLPEFLAVNDLKETAKAIALAARDKKEIILGMGAHPVKCGLSPYIIDMMEKGFITCVAMNGAGSIHDFEIAYHGETSEDVAETLQDGSFGMVEETGAMINEALAGGVSKNLGAGASVGEYINSQGFKNAVVSIQSVAKKLGIDVTVHIAIGTDTIHVHPSADGAVIGKASHLDMMKFTEHVSRLENGVYINLGSAVIMPEVFLKALSAARNMGFPVYNFTTVNMDMTTQYRPSENVLRRPGMTGAKAINLTGHHEIMFPLLAHAMNLERERL
jgi:hypothetical protein